MLLTIILNNHNYGRFIASAIESVLNQTYHDFELLIIDDGSTDNSLEVISAYNDRRINRIFKENGGQASALVVGIKAAKGDYIAFLDSDDVWASNKLQRCVDVLEKEKDIVLLNHGFNMVDYDGNPLSCCHRFTSTERYQLREDFRRSKTNFQLVPTSFFIGRRKECQELILDCQAWKVGADTPVIIGLGMRGTIYNLDETLGSYRSHGKNLWHGRYTDEMLFNHNRRIYDLANAELEQMGSRERFDFQKTDAWLNHKIMHTTKNSIRGLWFRLQRCIRNHARNHS
jgi:glycosyltransferase involved in cell wall biosynthesis